MTAVKYYPQWILNWWFHLQESGVDKAIVFACSQDIASFCNKHQIPVFNGIL
jgi:hypothetical protein